jgi:hypothetical protein
MTKHILHKISRSTLQIFFILAIVSVFISLFPIVGFLAGSYAHIHGGYG